MPHEIPQWLHVVAVVSLSIGGFCAALVTVDIIFGHRQHMWIMNVVWPLTALWAGPLSLWGYFKVGRSATHHARESAEARQKNSQAEERPFAVSTALATTHCGAGCLLGDIVAEWFVFAVPLRFFGSRIAGTWLLDYALAFSFGMAFQYFTIVPMKKLSPGRGLVAALKADALSLTSWQFGMYGWMALVVFLWFGEIPKTNAVFWFMMQLAMLFGFVTSYPVNWWLLRKKIKESM